MTERFKMSCMRLYGLSIEEHVNCCSIVPVVSVLGHALDYCLFQVCSRRSGSMPSLWRTTMHARRRERRRDTSTPELQLASLCGSAGHAGASRSCTCASVVEHLAGCVLLKVHRLWNLTRPAQRLAGRVACRSRESTWCEVAAFSGDSADAGHRRRDVGKVS